MTDGLQPLPSCCELTIDNQGVVPLPGGEILNVKPIQKMIYGEFMKMHFASDIRMTIRTRLIDLFAPFALEFEGPAAPPTTKWHPRPYDPPGHHKA